MRGRCSKIAVDGVGLVGTGLALIWLLIEVLLVERVPKAVVSLFLFEKVDRLTELVAGTLGVPGVVHGIVDSGLDAGGNFLSEDGVVDLVVEDG